MLQKAKRIIRPVQHSL